MFKQLDLFAAVEERATPVKPVEEKLSSVAIAEEVFSLSDDVTIEAEEVDLPTEDEIETALEEPVEIISIAEEMEVVMAMPAPEEPVSAALTEKKSRDLTIQKGKRGRKSLKEMDSESEMIAIPEDDILFKRQYYSIGEVSTMFNLNTSLLRYWETEFDILKPRKNRKGDRHFRPEDIKNLHLIHHLLRQRKYTIEGAKEYLKKNKSKAQQNFELVQRLEKLKGFLFELKAGL